MTLVLSVRSNEECDIVVMMIGFTLSFTREHTILKCDVVVLMMMCTHCLMNVYTQMILCIISLSLVTLSVGSTWQILALPGTLAHPWSASTHTKKGLFRGLVNFTQDERHLVNNINISRPMSVCDWLPSLPQWLLGITITWLMWPSLANTPPLWHNL